MQFGSVLETLSPIIVYGLGIICPAVPAVVWSTLISAVANGDITVAHLQQFIKDHNIQTYFQPEDFPNENSKGQG